MMPFTRRIDARLARLLVSTCRGVAVVAAVFSVAVATLLVANYIEAATLKPLDNPALAALRERYRAAPTDDSLAQQIRAMDLAARRVYFTRQWQARTGSVLLAVGVAVMLGCIRLAGALSRSLPFPKAALPAGPLKEAAGMRIALSALGLVLLIAGVGAAVLSARFLPPETGASAAASTSGKASVVALRASAPEPGPAASTGEVVQQTKAPAIPAPKPAAPSAAANPGDSTLTNWPQFRGPGGLGMSSAADPPIDWDGMSGRNIRWAADMPLPGRNSPVVWGGRVFLTGADKSAREVFCWDTATGKLLWRTPVPVPAGSGPAVVADTAGYAPNTMAVNGSAAFAVFPNGDITALSFSGAIIWIRSLGPLDLNYGYASSPALCGDSLIIQLDQSEGGRLLCIKAEDGATRWEARRNVAACWASPIVTGSGKDARIFVNGTPVLTAYEAASGRELWSLEGMMGENAPSPAFADGRVFSSNQLLSLAAANAATGEKRWEVYEDFPDVASPLAIPGGLLIMAASYGVVSCLDAASGDVLWKSEFTTGFYASPLFAAGRIYALDRNGVMRILAADRALKIIGSPAIGEHTEATPAIRGSEIFIRGDRHLFCIGGRDGL